MNKQELEAAIKTNKEFTEYFQSQAREFEAELAALNTPPVTGRPFCKGINEPKEGQDVWYRDTNDFRVICGSFISKFSPAVGRIFADLLRRGELYPTEQDCIEGNRRDEIRKRYEALGDGFHLGGENWEAYYDHKDKAIVPWDAEHMQDMNVYFGTRDRLLAAISTINREYGPGAFEWACLGVKSNG